MPNVKGLLADPEFNKLDPGAQRHVLGQVDPQFEQLSDADYQMFRQKVGPANPVSTVASPPDDSIWNRFSQTVTTNSPLNPMNWPGMVKSAFESPFSDQNMQEAQHRANVFNSGAPGEPMYGAGKNLKAPSFPNTPPEPFTRGDIGEGLGHLANGVAMYGLGNEIGAEPPVSMPNLPSFTNLPQQVMAGVRAGAPGVMQGGGKLAAGAAVAKVLPHEAQIALGYPMYQGAKQVGEGLSKGYKAFKSAGIEPPPTFGPTAPSTSGNARFVPGQYDAPVMRRSPVETGRSHVPDYQHPGPSPEEILKKIGAPPETSGPTAPSESGSDRFKPGQYDAPKIQRPPVETGGGHVPDYKHPGPSPEGILQKIAADEKAKLNAAPTAPAPAAKSTTPTVAPPPAPIAETAPAPAPAPLVSSAEQSLPGGRAVVGEGQIPVTQHETVAKVDQQTQNKISNLAEYLRSKGGTPEHLDMIVKDPQLTKQYLREAHTYGTNRGNPVPKTGYKGLDPGSDSHMQVRQRILDMIEEEKNKGKE